MTILSMTVLFGGLHLVDINKMKIFIRIIAIILLFNLPSCRWFTNAEMPLFGGSSIKIPKGTPTFKKGFRDGCSSVLYARGNLWYRTRYDYRYDVKLMGNPEYRFGHTRGYNWCFHNAVGPAGLVGSPDRYLFIHGYDKTFNAGNVNDGWGGMFGGGIAPLINVTGGGLNGVFDVLQKGGGGTGKTAFGTDPLWYGGSKGQFFGQ